MGQKINSNLFRIDYKQNDWPVKLYSVITRDKSYYLNIFLEILQFLRNLYKDYGIILNHCKIMLNEENLNIKLSYIYLPLRQKFKYLKFDYFENLIVNVLKNFFNKKIKINVIFIFLNKSYINFIKKSELLLFKKIIFKLRRYSNLIFFKESLNILLISIKNYQNSSLLSNYLSYYFGMLKSHNFLLNFIKHSLNLLINSKISTLKGLKIMISGRINGKPRGTIRVLQIGKISLQSLESKIGYSKSVAYSLNGTLGIKVWLCSL